MDPKPLNSDCKCSNETPIIWPCTSMQDDHLSELEHGLPSVWLIDTHAFTSNYMLFFNISDWNGLTGLFFNLVSTGNG